MSPEEQDALLIRLDEGMAWLKETYTEDRQTQVKHGERIKGVETRADGADRSRSRLWYLTGAVALAILLTILKGVSA